MTLEPVRNSAGYIVDYKLKKEDRTVKVDPKWKSRKWLVTLVALLYGVVIHIFPEVSGRVAKEDLLAVVSIVLTWMGFEGAADIKSRPKSDTKR